MPQLLTRADWVALCDRLLTALEPYRSPGGALLTPPGGPGGYGHLVDGLEGYARSFLLAGFRIAGERGADPADLAGRYACGLVAGTDPASTERWPRMSEHPQAKVEAASIALILDLTRPWIWDRLAPAEQERVVDYLAECVGDESYPRINWVWFRLVVQTFLRSVGGPHSLAEMRADLAAHDSFARAGGWFADGAERSYDHYNGWALHLYPILWGRMAGAEDLAGPRRAADRARLAAVLPDLLHLIGADGAPLIQGRSLVYRFAAAAPYWVGALAEVEGVPLGRLRRAAQRVVEHFLGHGVPDERGLLTLGWHHEWRRLAQSYSGPASPYWAAKGLLGVALPEDHPVWQAEEESLPVEEATPRLRAAPAPGWLISTAGGVARVTNHGTDHDVTGSERGDSPLYARYGYSTATAPLLDDASWAAPVDQAVVLLNRAGRRTHRAGMEVQEVRVLDVEGESSAEKTGTGHDTAGAPGAAAGLAASRSEVRWLDAEPPERDHGSAWAGTPERAGTLTVVSVVRGPWELRLLRVSDPAPETTGWEAGGWALAADDEPATAISAQGAEVTDGHLVSTVRAVTGVSGTRVERREEASPLGRYAAVPVVGGPARPGEWQAVAVGLVSGPSPVEAPRVAFPPGRAAVRWPDGTRSTIALPN